ncbi:disintegrin and metalloproteinase domain-containing protein adm-2 [Helicoverpa armigera]|uniref:disintegrin and metalloproteinase domain-containing protein adm-2 n=1 Tax=Helicoverpa armigera TaxID=29058 RepID=UPI0030839E13
MSQITFRVKMFSDNVCVLCLVHLLILLALTKSAAEAQEPRQPALDFNKHKLIQPIVHHGRTKREISSTRDTSGAHHSEVTVTVPIDGQEYILDLRLNHDLVTDNHVLRYQKNGKTVTYKPTKEDIDLCQYSGSVRGKPGSWVAVSTCHGIRGIVFDGERMKYIEPAEGPEIQSNHYIYDHGDLNNEYHCGYEGGVTHNASYDPELFHKYHREKDMQKSRITRYKRNADDTEVRGPYNANKLSRYVELVLVADNREYKANGENIQTVYRQMKDVANIINSVYSPLNIFIALVGVVVWSENDEIVLEENGDRTLNNFLGYRKSVLVKDIPNDNAQLLTRQKFTDGVVGKALKGPICTYEFSGGVSTNHSEVIGLVATTIAHEMGHNFGMEHDTDDLCQCPDAKCIMSPSSTSVTPIHWSSCSLNSLALAFERGMDYCLRNKPKRLFESPTCGNGFVEPGEQCDCGTLADPTAYSPCHACCEPGTCMLRSNATCGAGMCCDLQTCRPKAAGTVCRSADRECDLPEYCTGHSEYCPDDVYKMDTTNCGKDGEKAYCVRGSCRSHTDQCRLLWGTTGESSHEKCYYSTNVKGNKSGNCGYDRLNVAYKQCNVRDALCGTLQCRHLNERLEFGMESVATLAAVFINNNGTIIPCRTAIIDLGLSEVDPGLVPDGAKCGEDMMCLKQRCIPVQMERDRIAKMESSVCPSNCSGHGVCNSAGHCHCEAGFAPPLCALPGPGGSFDSGPATDPTIQRNFMVAMYVIFLGIIPAILLVLFLIYYSRHNVLLWWKKPRKSAPSPKKASLQHRLSRSASKFAANFQNSTQNNAQPVNVHTLSNPDDMSSSLLRSDSDRSPPGNINPSVNFFGNFKGFSLTPIEKNAPTEKDETEVPITHKPVKSIAESLNKSAKITPVHRSGSNSQSIVNQGVLKPVLRSAPPLPVVPSTAKTSPKTSPSVKRTNSTVQNKIKALMSNEKTEDVTPPVVANPPPRPVISSPILEASTCTAKELISPLQGSKTLGPIRAAPTVPITPDFPKRPLSMHSAGVPQKPLPEEPKKVKEGISLNRIASFLKHDKHDKPKEKERNPVERSHSLPKNPNHQVKVSKVDKGALRNLQISNPILQKEIELPVKSVSVVSDSEDGDDPKAFVNRAQSMRAPASQKPVLQSFGSMRAAPPAPRPLSVVGRPTAPPPPLPNHSDPIPPPPNPKPQPEIKQTDYVDCIEEKQAPLAHIAEESMDNIYAVIEESPEKRSKPLPGVPQPVKTIPQPPPEGYNTPKVIPSNSGSTESMGLLGEIVNEIQNRNFESIYSASTLSRKKEKERKAKAAAENKDNNRDSTYMNSEHYKTPESVYSNSGAKSNVSTTSSGYLHPSAVNVPTYLKKDEPKEEDKAPPLPGPNSKIPTFSRQVTPPALKSTSTFKNVPQSPKVIKNSNLTPKIMNSPDLVSSCTLPEAKNVKPPDVINNNKLPNDTKATTKPAVTAKPNDNRPPLRPAPTEPKKPNKITPPLKPVNSNSNLNKVTDKTPPANRAISKVDSVKAIADNLNKNKPKVVPKPPTVVQRTDNKPNQTKLTAKPSNVASLQQKFENRKSLGKEVAVTKK